MIHLKRADRYRCKFCKEEFNSEKSFLGHWDENHESYMAERKYFKSQKKEKGDFFTRPMEKELIKHNLRTDSAYTALRSGFTVNELLKAEVDAGVHDEAMTVVEIVGIPGCGKSIFALTLARTFQMTWLDKIIELYMDGELKDKNGKSIEPYAPKVYIGFDLDETLEHLKKARMGDTIIQDEDPEMMGKHSSSSKQRLENVLKIFRKACINFIFVSPLSTPYINMPNLVFEVIGRNKQNRTTKAALYDRKYHSVGWIIIKVLDVDDEMLIGYDIMKDANLELIRMSGGRRSVNVPASEVLEDVKRLLDYLKGINYNFSKKRHILSSLVELATMGGVEGDTAYQNFIAGQVRDILNEGILDDLDQEFTGSGAINRKYLFIKEKEIDDKFFLKAVYEATDEAFERIKERSVKKPGENTLKKFKMIHAEAWYQHYGLGLPFDKVGSMFNVSGQMIANSYDDGGYAAIYQYEIIGECAEVAICDKYYSNYKHIGGKGKPDLISKEDPKGDWIEVKIRNRLSEKLSDLISEFEYEFIDAGGMLRLVLILYKKKTCKIVVYQVLLNPDYQTVQDIQDDLEIELEDEDEEIVEFDLLDDEKVD
jgi:ABC-type dipeptide/oligopeptide/nickel transport system ATPase component